MENFNEYDLVEGLKVKAWGKELYIKEVRDGGFWLTESMDTRIGWFANISDITNIIY